MENAFTELWQEIAARPAGPFALRFYIQPLVAAAFAVHDGLEDARTARTPYGAALLRQRGQRRVLLREAWKSVGKIFIIAILLDTVYQLVVLGGLRPVQGLIVATALALVPYLLLRGPVARIARRRIEHAVDHRTMKEAQMDRPHATPADDAGRHGRAPLTPDDARNLAEEAFVYGYPLVLMDVTRSVMTTPGPGHSPANQFFHMRAFPDASFTDVVSPNADTLYSAAWLDLSNEPIVLSLPDTNERYYLMPMLSGWTDVFAAPGKRTTGTGAGDFAIVGPHWQGTLPSGMTELRSPTNMLWLIGRTQTNGKTDFAAVNALQDQYRLTPLGAWTGAATAQAAPGQQPADTRTSMSAHKPADSTMATSAQEPADSKTAPAEQVAAMDATIYFNRLAGLLADNPPQTGDEPMVEKLSQLGIRPGKTCEPHAALLSALDQGIKSALERIVADAKGQQPNVNGWSVYRGLGRYGTDYARRARAAWFGLGANLDADAMYPSAHVDADGQQLNGASRYLLHFDPGQLPPANAFWSLTMYNDHQLFIDNPLDRYAIGDRDDPRMNADGSLDLHVQHASPGADRESNWLPAPTGNFNVILRAYWPKEALLNGSWQPPALRRVKAAEPQRYVHPRDSWRKTRQQEGVA